MGDAIFYCDECPNNVECHLERKCLQESIDAANAGAVAFCESFEGSVGFLIRLHRKREERVAVGRDRWGMPTDHVLLWIDHTIEFRVRGKIFDLGQKVNVAGVDFHITRTSPPWMWAEGREMFFNSQPSTLNSQPT